MSVTVNSLARAGQRGLANFGPLPAKTRRKRLLNRASAQSVHSIAAKANSHKGKRVPGLAKVNLPD